MTSATGTDPQGGSVYYSVRDGAFSGACGTTCENPYASFLADRGKQIEVGVSWKDNPPGWDGNNADKETASQRATAAIAAGSYDGQFAAHPSATFLIRVDYEVSTPFFCTGGTDCTPYRNAFRNSLISKYPQGRGTFCGMPATAVFATTCH